MGARTHARRARRPRAPRDAQPVRPRLPAEADRRARTDDQHARPRADRRLRRRRHVRVGQPVRRSAAAHHHRRADGRQPRRHLAHQGVDRRLGAAARPDADPRAGGLVDGDGDRGPALLPADLRPAPRRARRHAALRPRQHADPGVGSVPHRRGAARRDDGRHVRRRFGNHHQRPVGRRSAADRASRPVGPAQERSRHATSRRSWKRCCGWSRRCSV